MIRAFWFILKLTVLTLAAVWVANRPGFVEISWLGYDIRVHVGLALLIVFFTLLLILFLHRAWLSVFALPQKIRRYRERRRGRLGQRALLAGFSAVAAGDADRALHYAGRYRHYLPADNGLGLLLEGQAARLHGDRDQAHQAFDRLLANRDAVFLGLRGLLTLTVEDGRHDEALVLAQQAHAMYPKQAWILRTIYRLQLGSQAWDAAMRTLKKIEKINAMAQAEILSDRQALLAAQADDAPNRQAALRLLKQAYRIDSSALPVALRLAATHIELGHRRPAIKIIEKACTHDPHPELAALWGRVSPRNKPSDVAVRLRWFEKLVALRPDHVESQLAVAGAAIDNGLWGEARPYLERAEKLDPRARLYTLWADMEDRQGHEEDAAHYYRKAAHAAPDPVWLCRRTGRIYEKWSPVAQPHGAFNTIAWDYPGQVSAAAVDAPAINDMILFPTGLPLVPSVK